MNDNYELFKVYANNTQYECKVHNSVFRPTEYKLASLDGLFFLKSRVKFLERLVTELEYSFSPISDNYVEFRDVLKDFREGLNKIITNSENNIFYYEDFSSLTDKAKYLKKYTKDTDVEEALLTNDLFSYMNALSVASLSSVGFACIIHILSSEEQSFFISFKQGSIFGLITGGLYLFFQIEDYFVTHSRTDSILQYCHSNQGLLGLVYQFCDEIYTEST